MSYYNQQQQPPIGVPPPQGYISQGEAKDAYPPPGYLPQQAYPTLAQSYPPQQQYAQPPPNQQSCGGAAKGCLEGWYLIASHTTDYQHPMLFFNTLAVFVLVVAKFPHMHKVHIFGINVDQ